MPWAATLLFWVVRCEVTHKPTHARAHLPRALSSLMRSRPVSGIRLVCPFGTVFVDDPSIFLAVYITSHFPWSHAPSTGTGITTCIQSIDSKQRALLPPESHNVWLSPANHQHHGGVPLMRGRITALLRGLWSMVYGLWSML